MVFALFQMVLCSVGLRTRLCSEGWGGAFRQPPISSSSYQTRLLVQSALTPRARGIALDTQGWQSRSRGVEWSARCSSHSTFPGSPDGDCSRASLARSVGDKYPATVPTAARYSTHAFTVQPCGPSSVLWGGRECETTGDDTWRKGRRVSPFALLTASRPAWRSSSGALGCMIESHRWATDQEREGSSAVVKVIPTNVSHARLSDFHL